ncbi:glycosyltransferase [Candidatus Peregrinibacteria bacterium]|nr:glycosyltransferase [Candidatus Peregrinibacteria bacterium]
MVIAIDLRPLLNETKSGVEVYCDHIIRHLLKNDKKNKYVLFVNSFANKDHILNKYKKKNTVLIHTRIPNKIFNLALAIFKKPKLDIFLYRKTGCEIDTFFFPDLRPAPVSKSCQKVMTVHDLAFKHFPNFFSLKSRLWYLLIKPLKEYKSCKQLIAVSNFTKKDLIIETSINEKKIITIHEACPDLPQHSSNKKKPAFKYLFTISTIEPRKNLNRLIEAFSLFKHKNQSKIKLLVAGEKNLKVFSNQKLDSNEDIVFLGSISDEEKVFYLKHAEAFIAPSVFEGFGLPIVEAKTFSLPILCSNNTSFPEIAGKEAYYFDPHKTKSIEKALTIFCRSKKAKKSAPLKNNWDQVAKQTLTVLASN